MTTFELAQFIDHTNLKSDATTHDIEKLCLDAIEFNFFSVCVNSSYVSLCKKFLGDNSKIKICSVVGFPLGAMDTKAKTFETKIAIQNGANEIDMVINIGRFKSNDLEFVKNDIQKICELAHNENVLVKTIIETCLLNEEEKIVICNIAKNCRVDFVKTSTGFSTGGAKVEDIILMKKIVGENIGVKASGGIKTYDDVIKMIQNGASRIGTSSGVSILLQKIL